MKGREQMNKIFKKIISTALLGSMIFAFAGCGTQENDNENTQSKIIVDHTGTEVEIPEKIERVVITSIAPLPSVYCLFRGSTEGLVGLSPTSMAAAENSYLAEVYPEITEIDTSFYQGDTVNLEQLAALEPDVVFYSATNTAEQEMYANAGIPAIGFSTTMAEFNAIETYANWIDLLGQIFGDDEKTDEIIEYGRSVEQEVLAKTADLTDEDRPKALVLFKYDNGTITVSGKGHFGQYWLDTAGAVNVAEGLDGQPTVNMEQIYAWNPDMIFITNFSPYLPEDLINNTIEGHDWSSVKAVQEGKVYKFPLGMYRWYPPSSDTPLSLMWLAKTIQPELFSDIDFDQEVKAYFAKYYNVELTDEDLEAIYNPLREASGK